MLLGNRSGWYQEAPGVNPGLFVCSDGAQSASFQSLTDGLQALKLSPLHQTIQETHYGSSISTQSRYYERPPESQRWRGWQKRGEGSLPERIRLTHEHGE